MESEKFLVECIAKCDEKGGLRPMRIRFEDEEGTHVIKVDKVLEQEVKNTFGSMNGNQAKSFHYKCESIIDNIKITFKLLFDNRTCKWYMLKIV